MKRKNVIGSEPTEVKDHVHQMQASVFCRLAAALLGRPLTLAGLLALLAAHLLAQRTVGGGLGLLALRAAPAGGAPAELGGTVLVVEALHRPDGVAQGARLARREAVEGAQLEPLQHLVRQDAGLGEAALQRELAGLLEQVDVLLVQHVPATEGTARGEGLAVLVGQPLEAAVGVLGQELGALLGQELGVGLGTAEGHRVGRELDHGYDLFFLLVSG